MVSLCWLPWVQALRNWVCYLCSGGVTPRQHRGVRNKTPYYLTFGQNPQVGISNLPIFHQLMDKLKNEWVVNHALGLPDNVPIDKSRMGKLSPLPASTNLSSQQPQSITYHKRWLSPEVPMIRFVPHFNALLSKQRNSLQWLCQNAQWHPQIEEDNVLDGRD